jgi:hypothetical protein
MPWVETTTENDILYSMEPSKLDRIHEERKAIQYEVKSRLSGALTGAFGLVAALAWNDAVKALIEYFYPAKDANGLGTKFLYAIVVTLLVSIAVYFLTKFFSDKEKK